MTWNRQRIDEVAIGSASTDYAAFEAMGLSEMEGACVLDVGCFDGFNTVLKFKPYANVERIVGVDPEAECVALAEQATDDARFSWAVASAETCDLPDESFDVVYFSHTLQHVADKEKALANAFRMLKPGGFLVAKTIDDALMMSYPDPDCVLKRVRELYEEAVRPYREHTRHTDRYMGSKCHSLLVNAGFEAIRVRVTYTDTAGKPVGERLALLDRMTYYRRNVPDRADGQSGLEAEGTVGSQECRQAEAQACEQESRQAQRLMDDLMAQWEALFKRDDYYFATPTVLVLARKPGGGPFGGYWGPLFGEKLQAREREGAGCFSPDGEAFGECQGFRFAHPTAPGGLSTAQVAELQGDECVSPIQPADGLWSVRPMEEQHLGQVMAIELESFPDPWAPSAYVAELRHNGQARYVVAVDHAGKVRAYAGWWLMPGETVIMHIAVAADARRQGLGRLLLERAFHDAQATGVPQVRLTVRKSNIGAQSFYGSLGFEAAGYAQGYYANPDEDGIVMQAKVNAVQL